MEQENTWDMKMIVGIYNIEKLKNEGVKYNTMKGGVSFFRTHL
jgi:hypothetical protein